MVALEISAQRRTTHCHLTSSADRPYTYLVVLFSNFLTPMPKGESTLPLVKVKTKYQITLPTTVREQAGIDVGDLLEAKDEKRSNVRTLPHR